MSTPLINISKGFCMQYNNKTLITLDFNSWNGIKKSVLAWNDDSDEPKQVLLKGFFVTEQPKWITELNSENQYFKYCADIPPVIDIDYCINYVNSLITGQTSYIDKDILEEINEILCDVKDDTNSTEIPVVYPPKTLISLSDTISTTKLTTISNCWFQGLAMTDDYYIIGSALGGNNTDCRGIWIYDRKTNALDTTKGVDGFYEFPFNKNPDKSRWKCNNININPFDPVLDVDGIPSVWVTLNEANAETEFSFFHIRFVNNSIQIVKQIKIVLDETGYATPGGIINDGKDIILYCSFDSVKTIPVFSVPQDGEFTPTGLYDNNLIYTIHVDSVNVNQVDHLIPHNEILKLASNIGNQASKLYDGRLYIMSSSNGIGELRIYDYFNSVSMQTIQVVKGTGKTNELQDIAIEGDTIYLMTSDSIITKKIIE